MAIVSFFAFFFLVTIVRLLRVANQVSASRMPSYEVLPMPLDRSCTTPRGALCLSEASIRLGESLSAAAEAIVCISADESTFGAFTLLYHHSSKAML